MSKSELFNLTVLDLPDQTELVLYAKFQYIQGILGKVPRAERIIHLTQIASSSIEKYKDINDAFLYGILACDTQASNECFQLLHSIMQDQWDSFCSQARYFTYSKFQELKSRPRMHLLWLVDKLTALQARGTENLLIGLLKHIKGGDYSAENVTLIQSLYQIFINHKNWYNQQPQLIPFSIYSFLRIISGNGIDLGLRKELATFCSVVLIEKLKECFVIGRDLIRILQDVSRMSEFTNVWKLLYQKSSTGFESSQLYKILQVPTPKRFVACRLTPEMEMNLLFILDHVRYGGSHHRKYYEWFSNEYLKVSDPENILIDIIRYLIVAYHPPNSILASSSVQRWQIITWFLRQMKTNYSTANAKLALFYDWLFYDPSIDNIMNVEPAILIISKSVSASPKISCTMIEFLYLLKRNYLPILKESIEINIDKTMFDILSKRVISNLESILLSDQIGEEIKKQTKELFPCYSKLTHNNGNNNNNTGYSNENKNNRDNKGSLSRVIITIEKSLNDSSTQIIELTKKFVEELGRISDSEFEEIESLIVDLINNTNKFNNFESSGNSNIDNWANALRMAFNDSDLEKDIIDGAIEKISLLPLTEFNIETFLMTSPKPFNNGISSLVSSASIASSSSSSSSSSSEMISSKDDEIMSNGIEDQIRKMKSSDPKTFYSDCFTQFYLELSESPNIIDILGVILEDTDPSQLLDLKTQLLIGSRNPFTVNWTNLTKSLSITKDWDGYCQIFLWDLILICLKQVTDTFGAFKEILRNLKGVLHDSCNDIIFNGIINVSISLYPKAISSSVSAFNEYFSWLLLLLEDGGSAPVTLSILTFYWRSNSRFFLQSLVRLDEEGPIKFNQFQVKTTLTAFAKNISLLEENSPAKKSLLSCVDTTIALLNKEP